MSQPDPQTNDLPSMHDELRHFITYTMEATPARTRLLDELEARKDRGLETYKTLLQPFNGRDAFQDAFEEAVDLAVYLKQALYEATHDDAKPDEELEQELYRQIDRAVWLCYWLAERVEGVRK